MNHRPFTHYSLVHYDVIVKDNNVIVGEGKCDRGGYGANVGGIEHFGGVLGLSIYIK